MLGPMYVCRMDRLDRRMNGWMDEAPMCSMVNRKSASDYLAIQHGLVPLILQHGLIPFITAAGGDWFPALWIRLSYSGRRDLLSIQRIVQSPVSRSFLQLLTDAVLNQAVLAFYCRDVLRLLRNSGILETNSIHPKILPGYKVLRRSRLPVSSDF